MELFRITQEQYADDLSGNGARLYGGRWNSEGLFAVYTSSSRALALLETLAHTPAKMLDAKAYILVTLSVPDIYTRDATGTDELPPGWDSPDVRPSTKRIGDLFLREKKSLLLAVPSVLMPEEMNYMLNPLHTGLKKVRIVHKRRVSFDRRAIEHL